MNTQELISHCAEYLDDLRVGESALVDGDPDELSSDALIVRFLNQAQRIMARRAWVIIDTGNAVAGVIALATGVLTYRLHKSVLKVYWAQPEDQDAVLSRTPESDLMIPPPIADQLVEYNVDASDTSGRPLGFATDAGTRRIRVFREPSADEDGLRLILKVARLPIEFLDAASPEGEPEVPEEYHLDLCDYAIGRCLMRPNTDIQARVDGRELLAQFDLAVKEARRDRQRQEADPGRWGFASSTARS